jgi:hypothetical protein
METRMPVKDITGIREGAIKVSKQGYQLETTAMLA